MIKNCLKLPLHDKKLPKTAPACSSAKYIHQTAQKSSKNLLIDTKYPLLRRFFDTNYRFFTLFHPLSNVFRHQLSVFHLFFIGRPTFFYGFSPLFHRFFHGNPTFFYGFSPLFHWSQKCTLRKSVATSHQKSTTYRLPTIAFFPLYTKKYRSEITFHNHPKYPHKKSRPEARSGCNRRQYLFFTQ